MQTMKRLARDTMTTLTLLALVAGLPLSARVAQDLAVGSRSAQIGGSASHAKTPR